MPRFSIRSLLLATTLIAVGMGLIFIGARIGWGEDVARDAVLWFSGGALIGAGIMTPFNRAVPGVFIGLAVQIILTIAVLLYLLENSPF